MPGQERCTCHLGNCAVKDLGSVSNHRAWVGTGRHVCAVNTWALQRAGLAKLGGGKTRPARPTPEARGGKPRPRPEVLARTSAHLGRASALGKCGVVKGGPARRKKKAAPPEQLVPGLAQARRMG
jgi:hypothetical protein